ncbi:hypothetical protein [Pseudomonas koreensis]|uniref:hypothetical protein n=1 Tax=Pseudomonas koreensis TaxID=198620 RepID=UPI001878CAED|nr:hypothetical protein [Pseudomonas koreensis]
MIPSDDFRFRAHVLLVELDATTTQLMMLVVVGEISGTQWDEALSRQSAAYKEWISAVAGISIDPMPALDGRAPGDPLGSRTSRKAARREKAPALESSSKTPAASMVTRRCRSSDGCSGTAPA